MIFNSQLDYKMNPTKDIYRIYVLLKWIIVKKFYE